MPSGDPSLTQPAPSPRQIVPDLPGDVWFLILVFQRGVYRNSLWRCKLAKDYPEVYAGLERHERASGGEETRDWRHQYKVAYYQHRKALRLGLEPGAMDVKSGAVKCTLSVHNDSDLPLILQPLGLKLVLALSGGLKPEPNVYHLDETFNDHLVIQPNATYTRELNFTLKMHPTAGWRMTWCNTVLRKLSSFDVSRPPQVLTNWQYKLYVAYTREWLKLRSVPNGDTLTSPTAYMGSATSPVLYLQPKSLVRTSASVIAPPIAPGCAVLDDASKYCITQPPKQA